MSIFIYGHSAKELFLSGAGTVVLKSSLISFIYLFIFDQINIQESNQCVFKLVFIHKRLANKSFFIKTRQIPIYMNNVVEAKMRFPSQKTRSWRQNYGI